MPQVEIFHYEIAHGLLPAVCAQCGNPAEGVVKKTFTAVEDNPVARTALGALHLGFLIVLTSKRISVDVPFCEQHRNHWSKRTAIVLQLLVTTVAALIAAIVLQAWVPGPDQAGLRKASWIVTGVAAAVWLVVSAVAHDTAIRSDQYSDRSIRLRNVHRGFKAALQADRARGLALDEAEEVRLRTTFRAEQPPPSLPSGGSRPEVDELDRRARG
jgi:hypothetical protein